MFVCSSYVQSLSIYCKIKFVHLRASYDYLVWYTRVVSSKQSQIWPTIYMCVALTGRYGEALTSNGEGQSLHRTRTDGINTQSNSKVVDHIGMEWKGWEDFNLMWEVIHKVSRACFHCNLLLHPFGGTSSFGVIRQTNHNLLLSSLLNLIPSFRVWSPSKIENWKLKCIWMKPTS